MGKADIMSRRFLLTYYDTPVSANEAKLNFDT